MIHAAVSHLAGQLNQFLKRNFDLNEDVVVVSNILEQDGSIASNVSNKVVFLLVNVEKESAATKYAATASLSPSVMSQPPLFLNLYLMVAANFGGNNYPEALKFLSNAIGFFQRQPTFDHSSSPDLDKRISKLVLDVENLNVQDLSSLWGILSGKYLPSILYKVRMVTFDAGDITSQLSPIKGSEPSVN